MGRRSRRGGGFNLSLAINSAINSRGKEATAEEIVDYIRFRYPNCARLSPQILLRNVEETLQSRNRHVKDEGEDNDDDEEDKSRRKKHRRVDEREEKLQRADILHVERRNLNRSMSSLSPSASFSEADGDVSTTEDAIYSEKLSPPFDLINDCLRDSYAKANSDSGKSKGPSPVEKNVELETVSNKVRSKMAKPNGEGRGTKNEVKGTVAVAGMGSVEVKVEEEPKFENFGGMKTVLDHLKNQVIRPLYHHRLRHWFGVIPMSGILLHGPPGCGKTKLAHAIANESRVPFYKLSAPQLVSGVSGASEENIRELFSRAYRTAPSIIFIDEIDAIASIRDNQQRDMERRIVKQLLTCMDESHRPVKPDDKNSNVDGSDSKPGYVLVIGATNRPYALDPALRRPGRLDHEIPLTVPDESARVEILSVLTRDRRLEASFDLVRIARLTPGYVGADLVALANEAGIIALNRVLDERELRFSVGTKDEKSLLGQPWSPEETKNLPPEEMKKFFINMADFEEAIKMVQPSLKREGFSALPNVTWEDVGGLDQLREEFDRYLVRRIKSPEDYTEFGSAMKTGFLLYGPPGCGKTLIAKAAANEAGANFIHVKGPELLNKFVGESELAVRRLFSHARTCSPCVIFFDEVDALTSNRGKEGDSVTERVLTQLLVELDGGEERHGVFVIGATNRPDVIDRAVIRPGRFERLLYVPLPNSDQRALILKALARNMRIDPSVDLNAIAKWKACENLSGADLALLLTEAAEAARDEKHKSSQNPTLTIKTIHFKQALTKVSPSVSKQQIQYYEGLFKKLQRGGVRNIDKIFRESTAFC